MVGMSPVSDHVQACMLFLCSLGVLYLLCLLAFGREAASAVFMIEQLQCLHSSLDVDLQYLLGLVDSYQGTLYTPPL